MERRIRTLEAQIRRTKQELLRLGELRPGTLSQQYNVCGTPRCRCKQDRRQRHGPYYKLSLTRKGRARCLFVRRGDVPAVKKQLRNYARLQVLLDRWIDLAEELCVLKLASHKR